MRHTPLFACSLAALVAWRRAAHRGQAFGAHGHRQEREQQREQRGQEGRQVRARHEERAANEGVWRGRQCGPTQMRSNAGWRIFRR